MALLHYSPLDVTVTVAGLYTVEGYVDGTFINISKDVKPFDKMRSMDGEVSRIYKKDEGYTLQITLAQSSPANDLFSAIYNLDVATQIGKFPLFIKDNRGSTNFMSLTTWVEDLPQVTFSNDMESRVWTFGCTQATLHIGGNAEQGTIEQGVYYGAAVLPLLKDFGLI